MEKQEFSKYERARIIGARGLQISMDAPLLIDIPEGELDIFNFDPLKIAEKELDSGVLPISISKPMPEKKEYSLQEVAIEDDSATDEAKIKKEKEIEKEILESGDMKADDEGEGDEVVESSVAEAPELE